MTSRDRPELAGSLFPASKRKGLALQGFDYLAHLGPPTLKHLERWRVVCPLGLAEGYKQGNIEIVIHAATRMDSEEYHLVSRAVHSGPRDRDVVPDTFDDVHGIGIHANAESDFVFVRVGDRSEHAQGVVSPLIPVPSRIWLLPLEKRMQAGRDFPELILEIVRVGSEREESVFGLASENGFHRPGGSLVEGIPKVTDDMVGQQPHYLGRLFKHSQLNQLIAGLSFHFTDYGCNARIVDERPFRDIEFFNVFLRPVHQQLGTLE